MKFVSRRSEFRLIIRPTDRIIDESRRPIVIPGERVEFRQYQFHTEDPKLIEYLTHHPLYGRDFTSERRGDATRVEKQSLVFDDGADLTGPKIVAGFPELNVPKHGPEMIAGAMTTTNSALSITPTKTEPAPTTDIQLATKADVEKMIDAKLDGFIDKITNMISPAYIKQRKFGCPYCHTEFQSGFEVGKHKKVCPSRPQTE